MAISNASMELDKLTNANISRAITDLYLTYSDTAGLGVNTADGTPVLQENVAGIQDLISAIQYQVMTLTAFALNTG